jgi:hypothetical protein
MVLVQVVQSHWQENESSDQKSGEGHLNRIERISQALQRDFHGTEQDGSNGDVDITLLQEKHLLIRFQDTVTDVFDEYLTMFFSPNTHICNYNTFYEAWKEGF